MSGIVTRRTLVTAGGATAAGIAALGGVAYLADRYGLVPPDHQGIVGVAETLTYATQPSHVGPLAGTRVQTHRHFKSRTRERPRSAGRNL
jgi:hypothetical protein